MNDDNKIVEQLANWTFPGLTLYYRDTPLTQVQVDKYQLNSYIRNNFFIDATIVPQGIVGSTRYLIASAKAAEIYKVDTANLNSQKWKLHVLNANSYFKVLDVYLKDGKTQITLLHIPKRWADSLKQGAIQFSLEQQVIDIARQRMDEKVGLEPLPEFTEAEWLKRVEFPLGLDPDNNLVDITQPIAIAENPMYKAINKLVGDTTELNK